MIVPMFKGKGDVMSCGSYKGVKLLEYAMKIVEGVLERQIQSLINFKKYSLDLCQEKEQWVQY